MQAEADAMTTGSALAALLASLSPLKLKGTDEMFDRASENRSAIRDRWDGLSLDQRRLITKVLGRYVVHPYGTQVEVTEDSPVGQGGRLAIEKLYPDFSILA